MISNVFPYIISLHLNVFFGLPEACSVERVLAKTIYPQHNFWQALASPRSVEHALGFLLTVVSIPLLILQSYLSRTVAIALKIANVLFLTTHINVRSVCHVLVTYPTSLQLKLILLFSKYLVNLDGGLLISPVFAINTSRVKEHVNLF